MSKLNHGSEQGQARTQLHIGSPMIACLVLAHLPNYPHILHVLRLDPKGVTELVTCLPPNKLTTICSPYSTLFGILIMHRSRMMVDVMQQQQLWS